MAPKPERGRGSLGLSEKPGAAVVLNPGNTDVKWEDEAGEWLLDPDHKKPPARRGTGGSAWVRR